MPPSRENQYNYKKPEELSLKDEPIISEEADKALGRIQLITLIVTAVLIVPVPFLMAFVNVPQSKYFQDRHILDGLSMLLIMTPFYVGMNILFKARLRFGREYSEAKRWKAAVAALEPFDNFTQRFMDSTGEAHFLLGKAYAGSGDKMKAERMNRFVLKHRPGVWADKLKGTEPPRASAIKASRNRTTVAVGSGTKGAAEPGDDLLSQIPSSQQEKSKSPVNPKRRKRF